MSFDNQATLNVPNMQEPQKPKSGALKWILGGCGCLALISIVCAGGCVFFFGGLIGDVFEFTQESQTFAETSTEIQEKLGSPVTVSPPRTQNGPDGEITLEFDVSGPNGNGVFISEGKVNPSTFELERTGMFLEFEGERIELNANAGFEMDLEFE